MEKELKEIANVFSGYRIYRIKEDSEVMEKEVIEKNDMTGKIETNTKPVPKNLDDKYFTRKGDILIPLSDPKNVIKIDEEGLIVPMFYAIIRTKAKYNSDYVYYALKGLIPREMGKLVEGTVLKSIRIKYLNRIKIPLNDDGQGGIIEILDLIAENREHMENLIKLNDELEKVLINKMVNGD